MFPQGGKKIANLTQDQILDVFNETYHNPAQWIQYKDLFMHNFTFNISNPSLRYVKSTYTVGLPVKSPSHNFTEPFDRKEEQFLLVNQLIEQAANAI